MLSHRSPLFVLVLLTSLGGSILVGCVPSKKEPSPTETTKQLPVAEPEQSPRAEPDEHAHVAGAHGGTIVPIGADSYHAEVVVESNGVIRLLTLGQEETRIENIEIQTLKAFVKQVGSSDSVSIELVAAPQEGDDAGKTSQFTGQLPEPLIGKPLDITIPNLRIHDERFRVGFTTASNSSANSSHDSPMPPAAGVEKERELYLTPGGKYTSADIAANGNMTASQKFKGVQSAHDMNPVAGDRICPVTLTKANPEFTWTIDGKRYQFCCPPCVDEFVQMAKEEPEKLKDPDAYVK